MSIQIFKKEIPNQMVFSFFELICEKNTQLKNNYYLVNVACYKKGCLNNTIQTYWDIFKVYYHISKQKYLERKLTYNSFTTVIRQICNYNKINYTSKIMYEKSSYNIHYYVQIPNYVYIQESSLVDINKMPIGTIPQSS